MLQNSTLRQVLRGKHSCKLCLPLETRNLITFLTLIAKFKCKIRVKQNKVNKSNQLKKSKIETNSDIVRNLNYLICNL